MTQEGWKWTQTRHHNDIMHSSSPAGKTNQLDIVIPGALTRREKYKIACIRNVQLLTSEPENSLVAHHQYSITTDPVPKGAEFIETLEKHYGELLRRSQENVQTGHPVFKYTLEAKEDPIDDKRTAWVLQVRIHGIESQNNPNSYRRR